MIFVMHFLVRLYYLGFQAVNFLDLIIEDGRDYITYLKYSLLNILRYL